MSSRRTFIKESALATAGLFAASSVFGGMYGAKKIKVLVIGAGLSGLAAAYKLRKAGMEVKVVESNSRVGGRVFSFQMEKDLVVELGGEWVGYSHTRMRELCGEFGLELFNNQMQTNMIYEGVYTPAGQPLFSKEWTSKYDSLLAQYPNLPDAEKEKLELQDWWRYLVNNGCDGRDLNIRELLDSTDFGESIRHVSAFAALEEYSIVTGRSEEVTNNQMDLKIRGGNGQLATKIHEKIGDCISFNRKVIRIIQGTDKVKVYFENGEFEEADKVICTLPTFAMNQIDWQPGLPTEKINAISELQYARINKHVLLFNNRFWKDESFDLITDQLPHYFYHSTKNQKSGKGALISYTIGDKAAVVARQSKEFNAAEINRTLSPHFGDTQQFLERQENFYWGENNYSRGAYALYGPGQWFRLRGALKTPFQNVHFAGEHIADWQGFMEGAIETGEAAANEILL